MNHLWNRTTTPHAAAAQALALAAESGDAARVESLLAAGVPVDSARANGETALMRAAAHGFEDVARLLLKAGADASARREDGFTPLILASFFGHTGVARLLLEHGADTTARTCLGTTAADWAAARGFAEISSLIENAAASSKAEARRGDASVKRQTETTAASSSTSLQTNARGPILTSVLLAELAPGAEDPEESSAGGAALRARSVASEMRARESEVTQVFGHRSGTSGVQAPDDAGLSDPSRDNAAESAAFAPAVREDGDAVRESSGSLLFAASQPATRPRNWQGTAGVVILAVTCALAVYAAWRGTRPAGRVGRAVASPQQVGAQPAAPLPGASIAPAAPSPELTPGVAPTVAQPGASGADLFAPYGTAAPVYVSPVAPESGAASSPAVAVGEAAGQNSERQPARREADSARGATGEAGPRESPARGGDSRPNEQPESGQPTIITIQPPRPAATAVAPPPVATPTPRSKVIQWPPS
jgi:hypothetical protein